MRISSFSNDSNQEAKIFAEIFRTVNFFQALPAPHLQLAPSCFWTILQWEWGEHAHCRQAPHCSLKYLKAKWLSFWYIIKHCKTFTIKTYINLCMYITCRSVDKNFCRFHLRGIFNVKRDYLFSRLGYKQNEIIDNDDKIIQISKH